MADNVHQNSASISKRMRFFLLIATIIILSITIYLTLQKTPAITQDSLQKEIASIQKKLPIRIDTFTELKNVELEGMNIKYSFLVSNDSTQVKEINATDDDFAQQVETTVKSSVCKNKNTRRYINSNVTLSYRYFDADDQSIASFEIPAGFCKK